jgi:hypothetical protein
MGVGEAFDDTWALLSRSCRDAWWGLLGEFPNKLDDSDGEVGGEVNVRVTERAP